jgi:CheY-like chemotaxis protein
MANILVIDDDGGRLDWFQKVLEAMGHDLRLAVSANSALDQFRETAFDVAFFDHDLGLGMNGSQLAYRIFSSTKRFKVPRAVWIHTSNPVGAKNIAAKCQSAGVPHCVGAFHSLEAKSFQAAVRTMLLQIDTPDQDQTSTS